MAVTSSADGGYMDLMTCEQAAHVILEAGATGELSPEPCGWCLWLANRLLKTTHQICCQATPIIAGLAISNRMVAHMSPWHIHTLPVTGW